MRLIRFAVLSLIIHALILAGISRLPSPEEKKQQSFSARLVTPEEIARPREEPRVVPPALPAQPKIRPHAPTRPPRRESSRLRPSIPFAPPRQITPEPVVPGRGSESGEALPKGQRPGSGAGKTSEGSGKGNGKKGIPLPGPGPRPNLFDPGVIAGIARKEAGTAQGTKDNPITFDTKEYRFAGYMSKLRSKIQSIWVYPPDAAAQGIYGDLNIQFTIKKDGRLGKIELLRTSGYKMLDDAAMKALKEGEPYWPLPDEWGMETYTIRGHFIYSLYGFQQIR